MEAIANHKADREELNQLINDYEETMAEFNDQVTDILRSQSSVQLSTTQTIILADINTVEPLEVYSDIHAIKTFWSGMVEADSTTKSNFTNAQMSVQQLDRKMITFLEAIGKNDGKVGSLDVEKLRSAIFEDKGMLNAIEDKLLNGESLRSAESDLLYQYLQNDFFDKEDHEKMDEIAHLMGLDDDEKFKDYINEKVLATEAHLEAEIMFLELYLFTGNERPSDLKGNEEDRIKWNNYLQVLKNAHMDINETREMYGWDRDREAPLFAHVKNIEFVLSTNPVSGHLQSEITIMSRPEDLENFHTREEVAKLDESPFGPFKFEKSISEIEYFFRGNGIEEYMERERLDAYDEMSTYTNNFIAAKIFSLAVGLLPGEGAMNLLVAKGEYEQGKRANEQNLEIRTIEQTASELMLEIQVSDHRAGQDVQVHLRPTTHTFAIIDRWNAIHQIDGEIPYPETEIKEQDWAGINIFLHGEDEGDEGNKQYMIYDEEGNIDSDVFDYIMLGMSEDNKNHPIVSEAEKIINH